MIGKICAGLAVLFAVVGAGNGQHIFAIIFAAVFLASYIVPKTVFAKTLLLCASGFSLILFAGHFLFAGAVTAFVILTVIDGSGMKIEKPAFAAAAFGGVIAGILALQTYTLVPLIFLLIFISVGIFAVFVREYRLKSELEGD